MKMVVAIYGLLVLIGLTLLALGIQFFLSSRKFRDTGVRTLATVTDNIAMELRDNNRISIMYAPLLEYIVNGEIS